MVHLGSELQAVIAADPCNHSEFRQFQVRGTSSCSIFIYFLVSFLPDLASVGGDLKIRASPIGAGIEHGPAPMGPFFPKARTNGANYFSTLIFQMHLQFR